MDVINQLLKAPRHIRSVGDDIRKSKSKYCSSNRLGWGIVGFTPRYSVSLDFQIPFKFYFNSVSLLRCPISDYSISNRPKVES